MKDGRPSRTAASVALGSLLASYEPATRCLVPDEAAEWSWKILSRLPLFDRLGARLLRYRWFRFFARRVESRTLPGIVAHYALRKRAIELAVRSAIASGCRQLVVIGAGYDTLGPRVAAEGAASVFELDRPETQRFKTLAVEESGVKMRFLHGDLTKASIAATLAECEEFDGQGQTVFVIEGVLMYLPEPVACHVLSDCAAGPARSVVVGTMMELSPEGRPAFRSYEERVDEYLERRGEPFQFGVHPSNMREFLDQFGLTLVEMLEAEDLRERYLDGATVESAAGEFVFVCESCSNSPA